MPIRPENKALYPANWREISHRIRFERAGGRCEGCGVENYQPHPETGSRVVLTVAHLDHDPRNCDGMDTGGPMLPANESNLRAWCQRCHNSYDAANRRRGIRERANEGQMELFG